MIIPRIIFFDSVKENCISYTLSVGLAKDFQYLPNTLYSNKNSYTKITRSYKLQKRALTETKNEVAIERRKRKFLTFHTLSTGLNQFPYPSQPKVKNGNKEKKRSSYRKEEKISEKLGIG